MSPLETIREILFSDLTEPCSTEITAERLDEVLLKGGPTSLATLIVDKKPNVELSVEEPCDTSDFYDSCPHCGKSYEKEDMEHSSAGIELGFNKNIVEKKTGVKTCSSFTYAMGLITLSQRLREENFTGAEGETCIIDEYGREYDIEEFIDILHSCPIQFDKLDEWFS